MIIKAKQNIGQLDLKVFWSGYVKHDCYACMDELRKKNCFWQLLLTF